ncbi:MAG: hypothetical protein ABIJ05_05645 [Patescibacteria group bacterium]
MDENIRNILILFGVIAFLSIYKSIKYLKKGSKTYYPFDAFFPQSGFWAVLLYLMIIFFFSVCIYIVFKFNIKFSKS